MVCTVEARACLSNQRLWKTAARVAAVALGSFRITEFENLLLALSLRGRGKDEGPSQPLLYTFCYLFFGADVKVIAVRNDRNLARTCAILFEFLRRIVLHRLLIAANEQDRAADALGISHEIRRVGKPIQKCSRRNHPPPCRDEDQLPRFASCDQRFRFFCLFLGFLVDGEAPRRSGICQAVSPRVSG